MAGAEARRSRELAWVASANPSLSPAGATSPLVDEPAQPRFGQLDDVLAAGRDWRDCYPLLWYWMREGEYGVGELSFDARVDFDGEAREFSPNPSALASTTLAAAGGATEPLSVRLLLAVSGDGVTWTKTGEVIANHASVPCLAVENDELFLFFNIVRDTVTYEGATATAARDPEGRSTPLAVARTTDLVHWVYQVIGDHEQGMTYSPEWVDVQVDVETLEADDPSVVSAADGGWAMYFTLYTGEPPAGRSYIARATTLAGPWTQGHAGGAVFPTNQTDVAADPNVTRVLGPLGGTYYLYYAGTPTFDAMGYVTGNANWSVVFDADGETVIGAPATLAPTCGGAPLLLTNALSGSDLLSGNITWYAFSMDPGGNYVTELTVDSSGAIVGGEDATASVGRPCQPLIVVDRPYEYQHTKDAAVVRFRDCYVMVYVAGIPLTAPQELPAPSLAGPSWFPDFERVPGFVVPEWLAEGLVRSELLDQARLLQPWIWRWRR